QAVIYDQRGGGAAWTFRQGSAETAITLKGRVRVTAAEGVREAVFSDLGLTVSSEWMFAPAEIGSGHDSAGGLVAAADRPMGGVPAGRGADRKGARFWTFRKTETVPKRLGSRQSRRVKPQSVKVRRVRGPRYGKVSSRTPPPRKRGKWRP